MKNKKLLKNPFLLFLPLLIFYLILILLFSFDNILIGDQTRYLSYAKNLLNGYYSPPAPNIDLGNGPGYPIFLTPFVALKSPLLFIKLMNGVFYYFSTVFLYKSLQQVVTNRFALIFSLIWAFYPTFYEQMIFVLPEVFASSLIPLLIFLVLKIFKTNNGLINKKYLAFGGFVLGYLALTKPIFGYVIMVMMPAMAFLWLLNKRSLNYKKGVLILIFSLVTTLPYLIYTFNLTGKIFYWSSFGGNNLYWMSTPYEGEYGSWHPDFYDPNIKQSVPGSEELIRKHHQIAFDVIAKYKGVEQDNRLKKLAIKNIEKYPLKFLKNCVSNAGRIIFNFPYNYETQKPGTLRRLPINGTILIFALFCLIPTLINWKNIPFPIKFLLFFALLYFCGSLLGSAENRMFVMGVSVLLLWIAYILERTVKIKLNIDNTPNC